jgi:hypothetical protein
MMTPTLGTVCGNGKVNSKVNGKATILLNVQQAPTYILAPFRVLRHSRTLVLSNGRSYLAVVGLI